MKKRSRTAPKKKSHSPHKRKRKAHAHKHAEVDSRTAAHAPMRIMTNEEKHELIRAHSESRHSRPREFGIGYYIAVCVSFLVVGAGWLLTLDKNFGLGIPSNPDPAIEAVKDGVTSFKQDAAIRLPEVMAELEEVQEHFNALEEKQSSSTGAIKER